MENFKIRFILASASPRRKELVGHLKIPFEIMIFNGIEESTEKNPVHYASEISEMKGKSILDNLISSQENEKFYVVSADTIVCLEGKIYGKPKNRHEASSFLQELSGKTHSVFTAVSMKLYVDRQISSHSFVEESKVTFNKINPKLLERYLDTGDSLDKAGAYGIQGPSLTFISKIEGDYANVVGFPLSRFIVESDSFFEKNFSKEDSWLSYF